ncbi:MAG: peptidylprolyl isomerase [Marinilabiliales bacterium]|nr:peptidylprolyl isomerase [Marinilabiliales bacterium]
MIKKFRKFYLLAVVMMAVVSVAQAQDKVIDQIVAIVGSNPILKSDIEAQAIDLAAQGQTTEGDMKCEILEKLLEQKLLLAEAELDTNIVVTDNQINQNMDRRMKYFIENIGSEKDVEKYFKKPISQLKSEMSEMIKEQLKTEQMQNTITKNVTATPSEVRNYFRQLPKEKIPQIGSQVEYEQITLLPVITEQEDMDVKSRLREFKRRVENGENFSTLAVLYSEDPGSARNGGEMGYLGRAMLDPAFATEAFNLKVGAVSKVVRSEFGYHIIQMIDKKGEKVNVRHILIRPKIDPKELEKTKNRIDSLSTFVKNKKITWEQAAYLYSSDKNTRNNGGLVTSQKTGSSKFLMDELDPDVSKIITGLKVGEISEPFLSMDDKQRQVYKMIKVLSRSNAHPANLQEDYQYLSEVFLEKKKDETYRKWIAKQQAKTYIHIDEIYSNCNFKLKSWKK